MIKVSFETQKIVDTLTVLNTVSHTLQTDVHVNDLMKSANTLITSEFVMHMSKQAIANPKRFGHMYDWGGVGDPNARLWKHNLRGRGSVRELTFDFKASKRPVPVAPALSAIGVKRNHIFVWKAPILELGLPVRISPKLAKVLVFEEKQVKNPASSRGMGYAKNGIVFYDGMINIDRQGSITTWNSFTEEFLSWFGSGNPSAVLKRDLATTINNTVTTEVNKRVASVANKMTKTITMQPIGIDANFNNKLIKALRANYIGQARQRRTLTDE